LIVGLGVYPAPVFERIQPSVDLILERITEQTDYQVPDFGSTGEVVEPHYGELEVENHEGGEG
jgi:hypothetical protein